MPTKIPKSVYILGLVSFFNDVASEMLYPVMPIFLTQVLGAPVAVVGLIDGVAEGSAAIFKTVFGRWSDRLGKRKPFVFAGYLTSAVSKMIIAISSIWAVVFFGRVVDKFGKGLRTGARDALLLDAADETNRGKVFGLHRTMDSAGAVVGPLIALLLIQLTSGNIRMILYFAAIPSLIGVALISFVREVKKPQATQAGDRPRAKFSTLPRELKVFLLVSGIFALGNSSDSFLILKSKNLGLSLSMVILAYVAYNLVYTIASTPAGIIADKFGPKRVFMVGMIIYTAVYLGFALNSSKWGVWALFAVYGLYIAFTDGVSKALVGRFVDKGDAGGVYGLLQTITSIGLLLASVVGGLLWTIFGPAATFGFGAAMATVALIVFASSRSSHSLSSS